MTEHNPTTTECVPAEVVATFENLLSTVDFTQELKMFKVGRFDRSLRKTLLKEFESTYIGLWSLALERSFPESANDIFNMFLEKYAQKDSAKSKNNTAEAIRAYREMMHTVGDKDFSKVSIHLLSFGKVEDATLKAETLRLSLLLRNHYEFIFQRLV